MTVTGGKMPFYRFMLREDTELCGSAGELIFELLFTLAWPEAGRGIRRLLFVIVRSANLPDHRRSAFCTPKLTGLPKALRRKWDQNIKVSELVATSYPVCYCTVEPEMTIKSKRSDGPVFWGRLFGPVNAVRR